jgi:hypothetical protein
MCRHARFRGRERRDGGGLRDKRVGGGGVRESGGGGVRESGSGRLGLWVGEGRGGLYRPSEVLG